MGQQNGRRTGEQALQHGWVVDQHVAGRGAHEDLDAGDFTRVEGGHGIEIVVRDAEVEGVIGQRIARGNRLLVGQAAIDSVGGLVFGMSMKLVIPPATAAADSVAMQPLCVSPGSRKCTWSSIMPGSSHCPAASISSSALAVDAWGDLVDAAMANQQVGIEDFGLR
jgi:hypothetical protein